MQSGATFIFGLHGLDGYGAHGFGCADGDDGNGGCHFAGESRRRVRTLRNAAVWGRAVLGSDAKTAKDMISPT